MVKAVNIKDADWMAQDGPGDFKAERKWITGLADKCGLGMGMYRVGPGKCAFPAHAHSNIDEAILILNGEAELTYGAEKIMLKAMDYVALPAGKGIAHQLRGMGDEGAEYLVISTQTLPDIVLYPNSNKVGVMTLMPPNQPEHAGQFIEFYERKPVGYFDGETD